MTDRIKSAIMTPMKTILGLYSVAKRAEAIWVLSPHSERKIIENPEIKALFAERLLSVTSSSLSPFNINMPNSINTNPLASFTRCTGMTSVTQEPTRIANPSASKKASITPRRSRKYSRVREESRRIDSWVLSPISARPTASNGIMISFGVI